MTPTATAIPTEQNPAKTGDVKSVQGTDRGDSCLVVSVADFGFGADITETSGAGSAVAGAGWLHFVRSTAILVAAVALGLLIARHFTTQTQGGAGLGGSSSASQTQSGSSATSTLPARVTAR